MANKEQNKKPEYKYKAGKVSATVWKTTKKKEDGNEFEDVNIEITKNYTDKEGNWQKTSYYNTKELMDIILVANKTLEKERIKTE